jgi:hypothetical protein
MSVSLLDDESFSLIAGYARDHPAVLEKGLTPEGLAWALHAANERAFRARYPGFDEPVARPQLGRREVVDPVRVLEAIREWQYNTALAIDDPLERTLQPMIDHIRRLAVTVSA